ncbi:hypothetical protein [Salmonella phage SD-1_S14]|uniref:Uncharacterized protein n=2 Tax=Asteriusvirus PBECO4 TaxID=2560463 RepID=A0A1C3S5X3_9CAUD|nr:hypothetical protein [Salmonella phage SD-2_S15]WPK19246.1 hypothetical protein [Salmonella phage SD-6_S16]WPK19920.1 hypothetical protein [Salmonella phage SD-1_S14]SCA80066.1 hypothetical protein PSLUR01_00089 [Escherichia phage vB_Eco_slurp01]
MNRYYVVYEHVSEFNNIRGFSRVVTKMDVFIRALSEVDALFKLFDEITKYNTPKTHRYVETVHSIILTESDEE